MIHPGKNRHATKFSIEATDSLGPFCQFVDASSALAAPSGLAAVTLVVHDELDAAVEVPVVVPALEFGAPLRRLSFVCSSSEIQQRPELPY